MQNIKCKNKAEGGGQTAQKGIAMKFEIIDNRELDLAGKGYRWACASREVDRKVIADIRRTRGEDYVDSLSDDFFDGYSPICLGDDGELYSVLFDFGRDVPRPVFWSKVSRKRTDVQIMNIKRVRILGTVYEVLCLETCNRCFGRTVYEDLQTGDLGVIANLPIGEAFITLSTFHKSRRFIEYAETWGYNEYSLFYVASFLC